jgi:hypothetical protein
MVNTSINDLVGIIHIKPARLTYALPYVINDKCQSIISENYIITIFS